MLEGKRTLVCLSFIRVRLIIFEIVYFCKVKQTKFNRICLSLQKSFSFIESRTWEKFIVPPGNLILSSMQILHVKRRKKLESICITLNLLFYIFKYSIFFNIQYQMRTSDKRTWHSCMCKFCETHSTKVHNLTVNLLCPALSFDRSWIESKFIIVLWNLSTLW